MPVHLSDKFPAAGCWAKGDMPLQFSKNYQIHPPISVNGSIRLPLVCNEESFLLSFVLCRAGAGLGSCRPFSSERGLSMLSGPLTQEMPPLCFVSPPPTVWPERLDRASRTQQLGRCLPGSGSAGQSQWSCEAPPPQSLPGLPQGVCTLLPALCSSALSFFWFSRPPVMFSHPKEEPPPPDCELPEGRDSSDAYVCVRARTFHGSGVVLGVGPDGGKCLVKTVRELKWGLAAGSSRPISRHQEQCPAC